MPSGGVSTGLMRDGVDFGYVGTQKIETSPGCQMVVLFGSSVSGSMVSWP